MNKKLLLIILSISSTLHSAINYYPFFYRTRPFCGEPRLSKDWLTSFEPYIRGGHAQSGFNACKKEVSTLSIYGYENIYAVAEGVPSCILERNPNGFINTLFESTPAQSNFGKVCIEGRMGFAELLLPFTQNFKYGFFVSLTVPIQHASVNNLCYHDQTTKTSAGSDINYYEWQTFVNNLCHNIASYGSSIDNTTQNSGLGDIQLYGGWTWNYENTEYIDFIDLTLALGLNLPTGSSPSSCVTWQLPRGYDGHLGIPFIIETSVGLYDWLTFGLQSGAMWFKDCTRIVPIKTSCAQSGWIRLAHDNASIHKGAIWHIDGYLKTDHLVGGISFIFGFSHEHANKTCVTPCTTFYNKNVVNSDERYQPWSRTAFHFVLDYDFASFRHPNAPHLSFTIDKTIKGRRVFDTDIFGALLGVDIEWDF